MSMRWMKLESTTFCTLFLLSVFRINKAKIVIYVCCLNYPSNKNTPKIKVLQMPWNLNMIFSGIFENIWHWEHSRGSKHLATRVQGAPPASWAHGGSPPLIPAPTHSFFLPKKSPTSSSTSSSSSCCHFRSPSSKLHSQNCFGGLFFGMWLLQWSN